MQQKFILILFFLISFVSDAVADNQEICFFQNGQRIELASSRRSIPAKLSRSAQCLSMQRLQNAARYDKNAKIAFYIDRAGRFNIRMLRDVPLEYRAQAEMGAVPVNGILKNGAGLNNNLAHPDEINLEGTTRQVNMASSLGRINLRWPRKVEGLFGRTPERAMAEAANVVSKTLKQTGFPNNLRNLHINWNVVFMDEDMPETQIPHYLRTHCHPGWMTPPANIYIVAQRVATGCSGQAAPLGRVTDGKLAEVLLHEMGHVVEAQILRNSFSGDKMRAEGFATWFEMYVAKQSSLVSEEKLKQENKYLALQAIKESPDSFQFSGTAQDYARASLYFQSVVSRRGVMGLMDVYENMQKNGGSFITAIRDTMNWSDKKLNEELYRVLKN